MTTIWPVILSGGAGTRLWPLSREHYPKQLLSLGGERSLLQETVYRMKGLNGAASPVFVCNEEHRFLVAKQLQELGMRPLRIILEPVRRNTAPALTLAALSLIESGQDGLMLVMPADHLIRDTAAFHSVVIKGTELASVGRLVTFGIVPDKPETGYGYIKRGENHQVEAFIEKPDAETAKRYLSSGDYLWNSGMFLLQASVWINELRRYRSDIFKACEEAYRKGRDDGDFYRIDHEDFVACPSDSIDYAVIEKTERASVLQLDAGWSDIGAWSSLWDVSERDDAGNVLIGDVTAHEVRDSLLVSQHRLLGVIGVDNLVVIETPDAVMVANKSCTQNVKVIVEHLRSESRSEHLFHRRVYRPWGSYEGIDSGHRFQVKRLTITPSEAISLQLHQHRAEHWIVVKGIAKVTRGEEIFMLTENQSTFIPIGMKHRVENVGETPLEIIEVQTGSYLGEDDIVRFEDRYDRAVIIK